MYSMEKTSRVLVLTEDDTKRLLNVMHDAVTIMSGDIGTRDVMSTLCVMLGFASSIEDEMGF